MKARYGMFIDIDRCTGCGACMVACAVENNIPPLPAATDRKGVTWIRVHRIGNGERSAFVPVLCQHCGHDAPCVHVCPQQAADVDPTTGIVGQMPQRCLGCRYCMAACPYHARYFNWWDPAWPPGMEQALNPDAAPRMRGVVEKCNFCQGRLHRAKESGGEFVPACVEACPAQAIEFVDLSQRRPADGSFRLLEKLGTDPKIYYHSKREWVREIANAPQPGAGKENSRG